MPNVILGPDNFLLFLLVFTTSLGFFLYTLLSYKRTLLVYLNASMFLLTAIRACTEFGLNIDISQDTLFQLNRYNSIIIHSFYTLTWYLLYYYIQPFKMFKFERAINIIFGVVLLGIPNIIICYWFYSFQLIEFSQLKLDGYWMYRFKNNGLTSFYFIYSYVIMIGLYTSTVMVYSIIVESENRIKKISLLLAFYGISIVILGGYLALHYQDWKAINQSIPMLIDGVIMTWFVSGYRLIHDQYKDASSDIVNSLSDLLIRTDKDYNVINMNRAALNIFKTDHTNLKELLKNQVENYNELNLEELQYNQSQSTELTLLTDAGAKHLVLRVSPYNWRGRDLGFSFLLTDITDLKNKEQQLAESNQTKDQLFSIIAHDMRKPALAFRGITKKVNYLLQKEDYQSLDKLGTSIERSADNLNLLLNNLLNWALSQKDMITAQMTTVQVNSLVGDVIEMSRTLFENKNITISTKQLSPEITLNTDADMLQTIIRNLIDNAIKYSSNGSTIVISSHHTDVYLTIVIKDEGQGMSSEQLLKINEVYKGKSTKGTEGETGSGLGLSLVQELVSKTNGSIEIKSSLTEGTEVKLTYFH